MCLLKTDCDHITAMFKRTLTPDHTVVVAACEMSSDDNDVPIYVIESNVRNKLKLDMERAKNEEKRLRSLERSLRRKEMIKVIYFCNIFDTLFIIS